MLNKTRFAILGTARIARRIAPRIHATESAELIGIASRTKDRAAEFRIKKSYGSYQEALEDREVDADYLPLPPSLHLE